MPHSILQAHFLLVQQRVYHLGMSLSSVQNSPRHHHYSQLMSPTVPTVGPISPETKLTSESALEVGKDLTLIAGTLDLEGQLKAGGQCDIAGFRYSKGAGN